MNEYVIKNGTLIDGTGRSPVQNATILIRNERISRIEYQKGSDLDIHPDYIDAAGMVVLPGIIDAHKHIFNNGGSGVGVGLTRGQVYKNIHTIVNSGVTSVLDLGAPSMLPLVSLFASPKPRIFWSGPMLACKDGYPAEYMKRIFYPMGAVKECHSLKDIRNTVRKLYDKGVDVIKTSVVSRTFRGQSQVKWTDRQLLTLTDEAHGYGLKVCAHITYPEDYYQAVHCNIDSIHHASFEEMYDKDIDDMIEKKVIFVPTLSLIDLMVKGLIERWVDRPDFHPPVNKTIFNNMKKFTDDFHNCPDDSPVGDLFIAVPKKELIKVPEYTSSNLKKFVARGGTVAMGTDSSLGFSLHTFPIREIEMLHECGLSNLDTIKASTLNAAAVFNHEKDLGSIEVGKLADILLVEGDVLRDISAIKNINTIIMGGKIIKCNIEKTRNKITSR